MQRNIHRKLLKRLFLGWLILSFLIGTVVFFIDMENIDDIVVDLSIEESKSFTGDEAHYYSIDAAHISDLARKTEEHIKKGHFIVAGLYDSSKKRIIEVAKPGSESVEKALNKYRHDMHMSDKVNYEKYYIDRRIYLQVIVPLISPSRGITGYFEGVYQVDDKTMKRIKDNIIRSLGQVIIVVLSTTILLYPIIIAMNKDLINLSYDLSRANMGMLKVLGGAISKRDSDTHTHNFRVTLYAVRLAETTGLNAEQIRALIKGAFLHDIGKIAISDNILLKPGKLSEDEFEAMKTHVQHGVDIINKYKWLRDAMDVVNFHHEKYDGSGYMAGLRGEDIPVNARIFSIADYFDALTSKRPYKEPFSFEKAMQILEENRNIHFEPKLLDAFIKISGQLYAEISSTEDRILEENLDKIIAKYFYSA